MSQLLQADGHCFFLPIDHGYFQGPTSCLEKPGETIRPLLPYCDALFVTRGVLRAAVDPVGSKPIILRVSGGTSVLGADLANESLTTSIEEILAVADQGQVMPPKSTWFEPKLLSGLFIHRLF
ncbi:MAG TPA: hypothetical protein PKV74_10625 [Syntrophales bacterium]|nr:hypothetical protein [Syntrophales bacterium]